MENFKMLPYTNGVILDNANHYGIVKTETIFRFTPDHETFLNQNINSTVPLEWINSDNNSHNEAIEDKPSSRSNNYPLTTTPRPPESRSKKLPKALGKKHKKKKDKGKKCVYKLFKKGKKKSKHKKYMIPLFIGVLAAKSLLIAIALKALAFISAKGLIMGFFSTMLASVLSLKGMFDHSHGWNRRDDTKTQVEIIQVPSKSDEHDHYYNHYRRDDRLPLQVIK